MSVDPDRFRRAYSRARTAGLPLTRAEFAHLVVMCPEQYRAGLVDSARAWLDENPAAQSLTINPQPWAEVEA